MTNNTATETANKTHFALVCSGIVESVWPLSDTDSLEQAKIWCKKRDGQKGRHGIMKMRLVRITSERAAELNARFEKISSEIKALDAAYEADKAAVWAQADNCIERVRWNTIERFEARKRQYEEKRFAMFVCYDEIRI